MRYILISASILFASFATQARECLPVTYKSLQTWATNSDIKATFKEAQKPTSLMIYKRGSQDTKPEGFDHGSYKTFHHESCQLEHHHFDAEDPMEQEKDASNPWGKNRGATLNTETAWDWFTPVETNNKSYAAIRLRVLDPKDSKKSRSEQEVRLICEKRPEEKSLAKTEERLAKIVEKLMCFNYAKAKPVQKTEDIRQNAPVSNVITDASKKPENRKPASSK